ncbi:hypothetical protein ACIRP7_23380 [Streptomyces sp. NPDC102270]|uniref:hypothetical protein n=1 Tax=Streptomyces sp. NPDC102270 TaxID=3366150 RepID=UPI0037F78487
MRQRVVRVALAAALVAVVLLAAPLALAIRSSLYADQRDTLTLESWLAQDDAQTRPALKEALATTRRLHGTVEEVLRLSRSRGLPRRPAPDAPVPRLLHETDERWHGLFAPDGRRLECGTPEASDDVRVPGGRPRHRDPRRPAGQRPGPRAWHRTPHGPRPRRSRRLRRHRRGCRGRRGRRLFDRGRTGAAPGSGIGLSLARDLAVSLGADSP